MLYHPKSKQFTWVSWDRHSQSLRENQRNKINKHMKPPPSNICRQGIVFLIAERPWRGTIQNAPSCRNRLPQDCRNVQTGEIGLMQDLLQDPKVLHSLQEEWNRLALFLLFVFSNSMSCTFFIFFWTNFIGIHLHGDDSIIFETWYWGITCDVAWGAATSSIQSILIYPDLPSH